MRISRLCLLPLLLCGLTVAAAAQNTTLDNAYARDPNQPIDQAYSDAIHKYTTDATFLSPLVSYLPASKTVPTPEAVLGDVSGAPGILPYAEEVYRYMRMLEKASPRVKVFTIGKTEEGREMIAVAVASEQLIATLDENRARLAKLADPRTIKLDDAEAAKLVAASTPIYYITGTIHSTETGAPTALMELAYRLAVDESAYIKFIRENVITLITPVVEVDGRDRMVDIYRWHLANPGKQWPRLIYWGHYVAHDNNRDAMGAHPGLTPQRAEHLRGWKAQVLHDLHESVPVPLRQHRRRRPLQRLDRPHARRRVADDGLEQRLGDDQFRHARRLHPWHVRHLVAQLPDVHRRHAQRHQPALRNLRQRRRRYRRAHPLAPTNTRAPGSSRIRRCPSVNWSQRDNNNYEESALLSTIAYFSQHTQHFLENYYLKSKRAVEKPTLEGPAAYIVANDPAHLNRNVELLKVLARQHVEVQQLTAEATVDVPGAKRDDKPKPETFPAGSIVVRMDQPYSRIADALLDRQYWAPDDPQKHPYDDTGWSFSELFNLKVTRIADAAILKAAMKPLDDPASIAGQLTGSGSVVAINNSGQTTLLALVYKLKGATIQAADKPFDAAGHHFAAGSLIVSNAADDQLTAALHDLSLEGTRLVAAPVVDAHAVQPPRIAFMHTWLATQTEGWWRYAFDAAQVPYDYISTQTVAKEDDLRSKYDVILFAPVGRANTQAIIDGIPMWSNAMPWEKTDLTPNLGRIDSTDDQRPGLGYDGLDHLKKFIEAGGLLITCEDTAEFAIDTGLAPGVSVAPAAGARVVGTVLNSVFVQKDSPVAFGYDANLPVMSAGPLAFNISNTVGRSGGRILMDPYAERPTGRGTLEENDEPEGRKVVEAEPLHKQQPWQARELNEEQMRNNPSVIPAQYRPDVILRFSDAKSMLLSGLLDHAQPIAEHAIVVDAHLGEGNVLLFANNPIYRGETIGDYALVFNAIMNHDHLEKPAPAPEEKK